MSKRRLVVILFSLSLIVAISTAFIAERGDEHCVGKLEPIRPNETTSDIVSTRCFSEYTQMLEYITDGNVVLPVGVSREEANAALDEYLLNQADSE